MSTPTSDAPGGLGTKEASLALPLVSVAIVTFNQREFLRECIDSVLMQDYPNVEIVVADDGSTDGTHELLRTYERLHPGRFKLELACRNEGITANCNKAHFACTGKYIAWMGGDDLMLPGKLTAQVALMEAQPDCSICYHDLEIFDSDSGIVLGLYGKGQSVRRGGIREVIRYGAFNGACASMVRSRCTPRQGFERAITVASDWLYWIETLAGGGTIEFIDQILGRYRKHDKSVTRRMGGSLNQATIDHLTSCYILAGRYPAYRREISAIYAEHLWNNRMAIHGLGFGITSLFVRFHFGRLAKLLLVDPARRMLHRT